MNKWTIILFFLTIVGGGFYLIPKIDITITVQYEKIETCQNCDHYDVTSLNGKTYHGEIRKINQEEKTVVVKLAIFYFIEILIWAVFLVYIILQIIVWSVERKYYFDTAFFQAWWFYAHKPVSDEFKQAFKHFFGYQ